MADVASLLRDEVSLTVDCVDRIFLQGWVPKLQSVGQVCRFLLDRGYWIPSSAAMGKIGDAYVRKIKRYARTHDVPVRYFKKGDSKEAIARPLIDQAARAGEDRVVLLGIAQEKASVWRSWPAKGQEKSRHPHMEWGRQMAMVNHYYFYLYDRQWGPAFIKTNAYAPWPVWLCLNGHEWAKQQLRRAGMGFTDLDNGFAWCADPAFLQGTCDRLSAGCVRTFFARWQHRLPSPFTAEEQAAGYGYDLAFRQFEVSHTEVFDRPAAGRAWFESVIRNHLDVGRPDQVAIIFGRRLSKQTPGTFRSKVLRRGVDAELISYYRASKIKQYFKEQQALRTETVINDTRDFAVGRRVTADNFDALVAVGRGANQRLCDAQLAAALPAPDVATFQQVTQPTSTPDGLHAPALRFGDPRVMAVFAAIIGFAHVLAGFTNADLVTRVGQLTQRDYTSRQATHDLRRLRCNGLIERIPGRFRYRITPLGRTVAVLFLKTYGRVLTPGLALCDLALPDEVAARHPLPTAWRRFNRTLDDFIDHQLAAAA
jgi:hypothetical protein